MKHMFMFLISVLGLLANSQAKELQLTLSPAWDGAAVRFEGKTNLPEGTKLGIDLMKQGKIVGQDWEIIVQSGAFKGTSGNCLFHVGRVTDAAVFLTISPREVTRPTTDKQFPEVPLRVSHSAARAR